MAEGRGARDREQRADQEEVLQARQLAIRRLPSSSSERAAAAIEAFGTVARAAPIPPEQLARIAEEAATEAPEPETEEGPRAA